MSGRLQVGDSFILMAAVAGFLDTTGIAPLFFMAAALHEAGHALAVRVVGGQMTCLRLTALGGVMRYRLFRPSPAADFWIAAAGPLAGLFAAWIAAGLGSFRFAGANLLLSLFNLLPVRPLDGGQMLESICRGRVWQLYLETACCLLLAAASIYILSHGGGGSLFLLAIALSAGLQKNLQKYVNGYKI